MTDDAAFTAFYETTYPSLWAFVYKMVRDSALADDITQEAFVRLLLLRAKTFEPAAARPYMFRIAMNLVKDHWRKTRRLPLIPYESQVLTAKADENNDVELNPAFQQAFDELSPQLRSLLWLAYVENYDHVEIATILRIRTKSVRVLLFRARQRLREGLRRTGIGHEEKP